MNYLQIAVIVLAIIVLAVVLAPFVYAAAAERELSAAGCCCKGPADYYIGMTPTGCGRGYSYTKSSCSSKACS